jgi:hypothetical protein
MSDVGFDEGFMVHGSWEFVTRAWTIGLGSLKSISRKDAKRNTEEAKEYVLNFQC